MKSEMKAKSLGEVIDEFVNSDKLPATAAKFLLLSLALGGLVFAGALAPALISAIGRPGRRRNFSRARIGQAASTLKNRKLIEVIREKDGKSLVRLTKRGEKSLRELCFDQLEIKRPKRWDGKWRVLMFDIPTKPKIYDRAREALRHKIKDLGFQQLQKSVWVYPYPCEDELIFLADIYHVSRYIEILTADQLLHAAELRKQFNL